jgi:hypothetical protein
VYNYSQFNLTTLCYRLTMGPHLYLSDQSMV